MLQISGHMIVVDGWGVDADGKEWFHVDKGYGSASGRWWDLDKLVTEGFAFYPNVFPTDLGGVIVGRVATDGAVPVLGATVTLSTADGKIKGTATTDANGCYAFTGLPKPSADAVKDPAVPYPEVHYTLTVQAEGYADAPAQIVTVESHVDDPTRAAKQAAWDEAHKDDKPGEGKAAFFELAYAGAVADFALTPNAIFVTARRRRGLRADAQCHLRDRRGRRRRALLGDRRLAQGCAGTGRRPPHLPGRRRLRLF